MEVFELGSVLLTLLALVYILHFCRQINSKSKTTKLPPSPPTLPIIGNLHQMGQLPHQSLRELSTRYGSLMFLQLGHLPTIVVSSAEVANTIIKTHDLSFATRPKDSIFANKISYNMKDLIHLPYGDQWRKLRSIFVHDLLNTRTVRSFESIIEEEIACMMGDIKKCCLSSSCPVNLTDMFGVLANDWICRAAFGKRQSETRHGKQFMEALEEVLRMFFNFTIGEFIPWLEWINHLNGYNAKLDRGSRRIDEAIEAIVEDRLRNRPENSKGENFLDILIGLYEGNASRVSIDRTSMKAIILDTFGAGTETSATVLTWTMTELLRHPTVMKKLQDEVREVMKGKQRITDNDVHNMHYLRAVIKETLRLHPPVGLNFRSARESVNVMGFDILQGTMVVVNSWAIGRDPSHWQEPEKFVPERFLIDSYNDFKGSDIELIVFGGGRRICPGLGFATLSIEHTVANLVHKFDWALPEGTNREDLDVIETPGFTIRKKNPLMVVPTKCYF